MAQAANFVHVTRELQDERRSNDIQMEKIMSATSRTTGGEADDMKEEAKEPLYPDLEKKDLSYNITESGSVDLLETVA